MEFSLKEVAHILNGELVGNENEKVHTVGKIESAEKGAISFLSNPKYENYLYSTKASAVLVKHDFEPKKEVSTNLIKVEDPYVSFTSLLEEVNRIMSLSKTGVENPSYISETAEVGENIYRGAFSYIGENVKIAEHVKIYPHVFIGDNVSIGKNTILYPGCKIHGNTIIGEYCTIHANAVIGSDGFGFAPQADGSYKTIPQIGNVVIEDHVSIGANTTIDCATMGSTILRRGVKLDNLIQVAHNVEIGENTVIAAQAGISGSAKIGKQNMIGGQVGISGHISIPDNVSIAAQAGIIKSPKEGDQIVGSPAIGIKDYFKSYSVFKNLPSIYMKIKELEEKIVNLPTSKGENES